MTTAQQGIATIESFLAEVGPIKSAEANTEPGSVGGPTTHPVKSVPDNTRPGTEGARAAENTKDVKADVPASVDGTSEKKAESSAGVGATGTASGDQIQIGTKKAPTGEDSSTETASAKSGKTDPGSSHPARTDNDALNGGKYAADIENMPLSKLAQDLGALGNELCSLIAAGASINVPTQKAASDAAPSAQTPPPPAAPAQPAAPASAATAQPVKTAADAQLAKLYGPEMAALLTNTMDKKAADSMVTGALAGIIKQAQDDADATAAFLNEYFAQNKRADFGGGSPDGMGGGGPESGSAPPSHAESHEHSPHDGAPPHDGGGAAGGGDEAVLAQLQALCQQLNISPEELLQSIEAEAGGGGQPAAGGPPAAAGAGGPMSAAAPQGGAPTGGGQPGGGPVPGMEVTAAARDLEYQKMANHVRELAARSRAKQASAAAAHKAA